MMHCWRSAKDSERHHPFWSYVAPVRECAVQSTCVEGWHSAAGIRVCMHEIFGVGVFLTRGQAIRIPPRRCLHSPPNYFN